MIAAVGLRWIVTLACSGVAMYGVWRASGPGPYGGRGLAVRGTHVLHALMALAMLAMAWPWGRGLAAGPQVVFFGLAAAWFAVAAVLWPAPRSRTRTVLAVRAALPHALMMAAMAWMLYVMNAPPSGRHDGSTAAGDMAGMDMSGGSAFSAMRLTGAGPRWTAGVLAVVFLGLALWWLARGFDRARTAAGSAPVTPGHGPWDHGCHGVMALGMSMMFVLLI